MNVIEALKNAYLWKKDDLDGIKARIRDAIDRTEAHFEMKKLLYENTENAGKMIRPFLSLLAAEDYKAEQREKLLWSAAAGEILHIASLLLDDIIDEAGTRRGRQSVQAQYGKPAALCAGNYLVATSYFCLVDRGYTDTARDLMTVTQLVCDGEMIQDENKFNMDITEQTYIRSISGKTASAFSFCCGTSSRISGHDEKTQKTMADIGSTVGLMFQIRDDIFDFIKDEKTLGKPACGDFKNGIYTLPAIFAFKNGKYADELKSLAEKRGSLTLQELERTKNAVISSGGVEYAENYIEKLSLKAYSALDSLPDTKYMSALRILVKALREF
ncbi:MAG: polyprenyl synthetase family protein [Clostridiales bacterium]|nr:polyprenyl synthetase family protein [Clostridiales bacterium]